MARGPAIDIVIDLDIVVAGLCAARSADARLLRSPEKQPHRGHLQQLNRLSHVAQRHGLLQPVQGIAGGDEFLADVALIADVEQASMIGG